MSAIPKLQQPGSEPTDSSATALPLWPTPSACNANDGEGARTWLVRREKLKAQKMNGNGAGMPLAIAVQVPAEHARTSAAVLAPSTSSMAGRPVNPLAARVSALVREIAGGAGENSCASLATWHRNGYWANLQPALFPCDMEMGSRPLDEYSTSFPRWGTVSAGESGVPVMSALRIDASGCSSWDDEQTSAWPTPTSAGEKLAARPTQGMAHRPGRVPGNLLEAMARELWPSPRASDGAKGGPNMRGRKGDLMLPSAAVQAESESVLWRPPQHRDYRTGMANRNGRMLGDVEAPLALSDQAVGVENWATPTVNTAKNNGAQSQHQRHGPCLDVQAAQWRSPNAYDGQQRHNAASTRRRMEEGKTLSLGGQVVTPEMGGERTQASSGQLNPAFVEILQGFPVGWTAVAPHPSPRRRKACKKKD